MSLRRQIDSVLDEPHRRLARAAQLEELSEDQIDGALYAKVRIFLQPLIARLEKPDRSLDDELTTTCLRPPRFEGSLSEEIDLILAHAPLEAEQQPIIRTTRIVDRLVIDEQRVDHAAHLDELVPVAVISREARDLDRCDGPDLSQRYLGDHALKSGPPIRRGRRAALVFVDDLDLLPTESADSIRHRVLQPRALGVVKELVL